MIYLQPSYVDGMDRTQWGYLVTPHGSTAQFHLAFYPWAADNEAFTGKFDERVFFPWLERMRAYQSTNLFVAVPDVVGDCAGTLRQFSNYAPHISALGYRVALVGQDGLENVHTWPEAGALFIGGSDDWKESAAVDVCITRAKARAMWVHVGRVNSKRRFDHFEIAGAHSCDGTFVIYGPDANWRRMQGWTKQPALFNVKG